MSRFIALALISIANPCFGQTSLEFALEGFDDDPNGAETIGFDNGLSEFDNAFAPSTTSELDDVLIGFEELRQREESVYDGLAISLPSWLNVSGKLSQAINYNFAHDAPTDGGMDHRGLSSMRTRLDFAADARLSDDFRARLTGHFRLDPVPRNRFTQDGTGRKPDSQGSEAELGEAFIQGSLTDSADITFGRQIVVWGRSDQFRVNDILNPVDNRMPGMTEIEHLRLPVTMARLDLYSGSWNASFVLVPENRFDKTPQPGSDYYVSPLPPPPRDYPRRRFGKPGVAMALTGTFSGWDLSLYYARILSRRAHLETTANGLRRRHHRMSMLGTAGNIVFGSWLLKAEAAIYRNLRYSNVPDREFTKATVLAGAEYSGIADTTLAFEAVNSHIFEFDRKLAEPPDDRRENELAMAFRINRSFRNDTLGLSMAALAVGPEGKNGGLLRLQASYELSDSVELTGGALFYFQGSQSPFSQISDNDRIFLGLDYYF